MSAGPAIERRPEILIKARYVIAASEHLRARFPVSERSVITASFLVIVQSPKRPKVSEPSGAAFESNGFPDSSVMAPVTSLPEPGCSDVSLGQLPFGARAIGYPGFSLTASRRPCLSRSVLPGHVRI